MKFYNLIKLNNRIKSHRLKFFGLFVLHILNKRYLAIHFDPVNACNLRCKMCYFTDKDYVKKLKGIFPESDLDYFGNAFFKRAIKLQIGCGTEPTLYKHVDKIIATASKHNVPYISLTTNANLLKRETLESWLQNGLSEITISLHGVNKSSYEDFMGKGDFEKFIKALELASELKERYPYKIRINYTFNEDNFDELAQFFDVFGHINLDVLQIRPISKIGNTEYNNFSLKKVIPKYDAVNTILKKEAEKIGVTYLAHSPKQMSNRASANSIINKYVYTYFSPTYFFENDFKWREETYNQYAKRKRIGFQILKDVFKSKKKTMETSSDKLNYEIS